MLRACDLVKLRVRDIAHGNQIASRATVRQQKPQKSVPFEITELTRLSVSAWIDTAQLRSDDFLFPSRLHESPHISTRQYARIVHVGCGDRTRQHIVWNSFNASYQSLFELPAYEEPQSRAITLGTHQAPKHCALLGNRS